MPPPLPIRVFIAQEERVAFGSQPVLSGSRVKKEMSRYCEAGAVGMSCPHSAQ